MLEKAKNEFDKLFVDFFGGNGKMKVDIMDNDSEYVLSCEAPGVKKENIEISYKDEILTISINDEVDKVDIDKYLRKERRNGYQERSFSIPLVDFEKSKANLYDGILYVNLPKKEVLKESHSINIE